ncbi:hypothetical protein PXH59_00385 (plasmid) [Xenorhabdus sp. SF857]|uniref:hypothetical protein n=1 Tax=Xenorhabdus bakwenae TaxID=3026967 RepID=UPI0025580992|nr:hypothetical protein [Xenorhabdus sp. SF857]WFQ78139.1 hypothetical protein PXH59_00385 [Xenorhabdus sp. SF857]
MTEITEKNDLTDFYPVDIAFGCHIVDALSELEPESCPHHVKAFLQRDSKQQVFRGDYDSPKSFIQAIRQFQKQQSSDGLRKFNAARLPLINYYRPIGFRSASAEYAQFVESATGWDDALLKKTNISISYLELTYRIVVMGNDKASVERLLLAWHMHIACRRAGGHRFYITYTLFGEEIQLPLTIENSQTIEANNLSQNYTDGRLYAVEVEHRVNAPVLYGKGVNHVNPVHWKVEFRPFEEIFL